jgi:chromosome segregation ATPase
MTLDIDKVEIALSKVPEAASSDTVAINAIAEQIRAHFKKIVPDDPRGRKQLALIMSRWLYVQNFQGIVLRLSGSIEGTGAQGGQPRELNEVTEKLEKTRQAYQKERQSRETLQLRLTGLEAENKRLKTLQQRATIELSNERKQLSEAQEEARRERQSARQAREEADQARREIGKLRLHLDHLQEELQARPAQVQDTEELAELRQKERHLRETEQHLRASLDQRDEEIAGLQAQLRLLTEDAFADAGTEDPEDLYAL